jgi:PTS system ascorbate-specific IIA component
MSVSLLIITHEGVGSVLLNAVKQTLGSELPLSVTTVELKIHTDPDLLSNKLKKVVEPLNQGEGLLILTDLFGSTPSNIARSIQGCKEMRIVTGLNLPMLIRVMNYPQLNLEQLAEKARTGGQCGIIECERI